MSQLEYKLVQIDTLLLLAGDIVGKFHDVCIARADELIEEVRQEEINETNPFKNQS